MNKMLKTLCAICCVVVLSFALAACGGVDKSKFTGDWQYESSDNADLDEQSIKLAQSLGLEIKLVLSEDGTGTFTLLSDSKPVTWEASSDTEGTLVIDNTSEARIQLNESELSLIDGDDGVMKFKRP